MPTSARRNKPASHSETLLTGRVIAAFGRHYQVQLDSGEIITAYPRGKKSETACGDAVEVVRTSDNQAVIHQLCPRSSLLYRADAYRQKIIAANVDQIILITATEPTFNEELLSRCIAAAEAQNITVHIVLNKIDLTNQLTQAREKLALFSAIGYSVTELTARDSAEAIKHLLADHNSVMVGQSGMGKSTIINQLVPEAKAMTREISVALNSGKHTTTFARRYSLNDTTSLIDSPGLQVFGLAHLSLEELEQSFIELRPYLGHCRFRDCKHQSEPGCALQAAATGGTINRQRLAHFQQYRQEIITAGKLRQGW